MASVALSETAGCCCALRDVAAVRQTNPAITNNKGLTFCILYFISIYLDLSIKHGTSDGVHAVDFSVDYKHGTPDGVQPSDVFVDYKHGTPDGVHSLRRRSLILLQLLSARALSLGCAIDRRWTRNAFHRIRFQKLHRFLNSALQLRIASLDDIRRGVLDFDIRRNALVFD